VQRKDPGSQTKHGGDIDGQVDLQGRKTVSSLIHAEIMADAFTFGIRAK